MAKYKNFLGLGIAGNFALHLAQAGELEDFKNIITADEAAPKGIFPFFLPTPAPSSDVPELKAKPMLRNYPLSSEYIKLPNEELNIQAEPEVGLICELEYAADKLVSIKPTYFSAYNDCSIRVAGASKISDKKNWGESTKGLSNSLIAIDKFSAGGVMDDYSIASFLRRGDETHAYGEDVELLGYSYFYEKLLEWMLNQINTQEDFGPLEPLHDYIVACNKPKNAIISIGATRYTEYGEHTFLKKGDEVVIVVYNNKELSAKDVAAKVADRTLNATSSISILAQKVI